MPRANNISGGTTPSIIKYLLPRQGLGRFLSAQAVANVMRAMGRGRRSLPSLDSASRTPMETASSIKAVRSFRTEHCPDTSLRKYLPERPLQNLHPRLSQAWASLKRSQIRKSSVLQMKMSTTRMEFGGIPTSTSFHHSSDRSHILSRAAGNTFVGLGKRPAFTICSTKQSTHITRISGSHQSLNL